MSKAEPTDLSYLPFEADYNDHFQTPSVAYSDLAPVILSLATSLSRPYTVYDPYYCSGSSIPLITASLPTMSKVTVINEPRDFYADIANDSCPTSDFIVTNPPYSETHKERCFAHCLAAVTSSFITGYAVLLPSYCVGRAYYRKLVETLPDSHTECIIVPPDAYEYKHPDDTGYDAPPFFSVWICAVPKSSIATLQNTLTRGCQAFTTVAAMKECVVVGCSLGLEKRLSSKARKRIKKRKGGEEEGGGKYGNNQKVNNKKRRSREEEGGGEEKKETTSACVSDETTAGSSHSKYRDDTGKRTKKRF